MNNLYKLITCLFRTQSLVPLRRSGLDRFHWICFLSGMEDLINLACISKTLEVIISKKRIKSIFIFMANLANGFFVNLPLFLSFIIRFWNCYNSVLFFCFSFFLITSVKELIAVESGYRLQFCIAIG